MRHLLPLTLSALVLSLPAQADSLGVHAGAGRWQADPSGQLQSGPDAVSLSSDLGLSEEGQNTYYFAFEHPIPLLPNVKLARTDLNLSGRSALDRSVEFDGEAFTASATLNTNLDLGHYDGVLYYEVLDNWVSLDLGLGVKYFDGGVALTSDGARCATDFDEVLTVAYARAAFQVPDTGLELSVEASGRDGGGDRVLDARAGLAYEAGPLVIEGGYRRFELERDDVEDLGGDVAFSGAYVNVGVHF